MNEDALQPRAPVVFCDESGNTGPDYLNADQPFYILAGWLVPDEAIVDAAVAVEQARKRTCPQRTELKATSFLSNDAGKASAVELFRRLGELHCLPIYVIGEKRYCISARIVDTFCDPLYNPLLTNAFSWDRDAKTELANLFCLRICEEALNRFADAHRNPNATSMIAALDALIECARHSMNPELGRLLEGVRPKIAELAADEAVVSPVGNVAATLNMPVLVMFLMLVENLAGIKGGIAPRIVHDEQHLYGPGYEQIFKLHKGFRHVFAGMPSEVVMRLHPEGLGGFEMADSKSRVLLQAADVLAGCIGHLAKISLAEQKVTAGDALLSDAILPAMLVSPACAWTLCSDACLSRLGKTMFHATVDEPKSGEAQDSVAAISRRRLEVLPPVKGSLPDGSRFALDVPLVGIRGRKSRSLMQLNQGAEEASGGRVPEGPITLIFQSTLRASVFLNLFKETELTEEQDIETFTAATLGSLVSLLELALENSRVLVVDPGPDGAAATLDLFEVVNCFRLVADRAESIASTGLHNVLLQKHAIGDVEVLSLLVSDGTYRAMRGLDGKAYRGVTRDLAVQALRDGEGI